MSSLFRTLFNLQLRSSNKPTEDYLTEIFAFCLSENQELLAEFLRHFQIHEEPFEQSTISTQLSLTALEEHKMGSRPDMVIFLENKVIFFENKVASGEGEEQLSRYAEHLDRGYTSPKVLVYITREYDPKVVSEITQKCHQEVRFIQLRWFEIYVFLTQYSSQGTIKQLLAFMKDLGLSLKNQFSPVDIITLTNFSRVRKLLNETMYGEVSEKFKELANGISQTSLSMTQLKDHDRYIYVSYQEEGMWVGLGYRFNSFSDKDYPEMVFYLEIPPRSARREEVIIAFQKIAAKNNKWQPVKLHDPTAWASIRIVKDMQSILSSQNHVACAKSFFLEALEEFRKVKEDYPDLPWRG